MNWTKLVLWLILIGLIVGGIIGLCYLFVFAFVWLFNSFYIMMDSKPDSLLAIVSLILTVWIFFKVSSNTTVKNYIQEKSEKWVEKRSLEE